MSFLFCTKAVASLARRTLFPAVLASMMVLGSQAASQAAIIVGLEQVGGPATADGINQTLITARLTIDLNGETAINAASWAGGLSWSVTGGTASVTDLYTVTSAGAATTTSNSALIPGGSGYLFESVFFDGDLSRSMNVTGLDADSARSIFFTNIASPPPSPYPSVTTDGIIVTDVRFAVSPGILNAAFSVDVLDTVDNSGQYFFGTGAGQPTVAFTGQAGTLQVVPEPSTMASLFFVGLAATGFQVRRLRRKAA